MNVNRVCMLLAGALIVCSLVMGCRPSGAAPEEGVLDVWATWAEDPALLQALLDRYTEEMGVPVLVTTGVGEAKLAKALSGSAPPDVVILSTSGAVASYHQQGLVEPLAPWIAEAGIDLNEFFPAPLAQCQTPDGDTLCLPWVGDVYALSWNKDLFAAAGLDPERPPRTMEELAEYAGLLTLRDEQGELTQVGFIPDLDRSHTELYARLFGAAGEPGSGRALDLNSRPMVDALHWQRAFYEIGNAQDVHPFARSLNRSLTSGHPLYAGERLGCAQCHRAAPPDKAQTPAQGLLGGRVAMMVAGPWAVQAGVGHVSNVGVAPFPPPAGHPERAGSTLVQGAVLIVPAGALDKAATVDLLAWMTSPEIAAQAALEHAGLPAGRAAARDPRFQQGPHWKVFMELLAHPNAGYAAALPIRPELSRALGEVEEQALHDGGDPLSLLEEVQAEFAPQWAQALDDRDAP